MVEIAVPNQKIYCTESTLHITVKCHFVTVVFEHYTTVARSHDLGKVVYVIYYLARVHKQYFAKILVYMKHGVVEIDKGKGGFDIVAFPNRTRLEVGKLIKPMVYKNGFFVTHNNLPPCCF